MPLLVFPVDNAAMQEVTRNGVTFDVCPQCRGVWLDRGELEKLLSLAQRADEELWEAERRYREGRWEGKPRKRRGLRELLEIFGD